METKNKFGERLMADVVAEANDPTGMNIIEAMEVLKTGKKVCRKNWPFTSFLMSEDGVIINFYGKRSQFPHTWRPVLDDLVSTNWALRNNL